MNAADIVRSYEPLMKSDHDARLLEKIAKEIEQQGAVGLREAIRLAIAEDDPDKYPIEYLGNEEYGMSNEAIDRCADIAYATVVNQLPATVAHSQPEVARVKECWKAFHDTPLTTTPGGQRPIEWDRRYVELKRAIESLPDLSTSAADAGDSARLDWLEKEMDHAILLERHPCGFRVLKIDPIEADAREIALCADLRATIDMAMNAPEPREPGAQEAR